MHMRKWVYIPFANSLPLSMHIAHKKGVQTLHEISKQAQHECYKQIVQHSCKLLI